MAAWDESRYSVTREQRAVDSETTKMRARIASGASLERVGEGLVAAEK